MTRTREDEALADLEVTWKSIAESVPDQMVLLRPDGRILFANRGLPGGRVHEAIGEPYYDQVPPEFRELARRSLDRALVSGETMRYETRHTTRAGEVRFLVWIPL